MCRIDAIRAENEAKKLVLASNKMEQVQYDKIVNYLRTGRFPSPMAKNEKDSLRRKAKNQDNKSWFIAWL